VCVDWLAFVGDAVGHLLDAVQAAVQALWLIYAHMSMHVLSSGLVLA
jgi:hypothetical protein